MPPSDLGDATLKEALDRLEKKDGIKAAKQETGAARHVEGRGTSAASSGSRWRASIGTLGLILASVATAAMTQRPRGRSRDLIFCRAEVLSRTWRLW
jgi:hypothetical protein